MTQKTAAPAPQEVLESVISQALKRGADAADALLFDSASLSLSQRMGKPEQVERAEAGDLGLRVFVGKRQAVVSTTDRSPDFLAEMVERAVAMARVVPEDPFCGIADPDQLTRSLPDLDLADPDEPSPERLIRLAGEAEAAALAVEGVTNSEGADASWSRSQVTLAASNGFTGSYAVTRHSISASVLAGSGTQMERDYDHHSTVFAADLESAARIGRHAGERAVAKLNPRKVKTTRVPVVLDPRVAGSILGHLVGAITGPAVARGTSFLKDQLEKQIFAAGVEVVDDPHLRRGLRSKPFDAEGIAAGRRRIIADGHLTSWLLDLRSARQLKLAPTGHASRGTGGPPSPAPTNLCFAAGTVSPEALLADIEEGFYVNSLMGQGVNGVTGDYSRGAGGFWIEKGRITYPVSELTIAGNLKDMFRALTVANDLERRYGVDSPTLRIDGMMVAGT